MQTDKILALAKKVAKKAREIIPRSSNRAPVYSHTGLTGSSWAKSSTWDLCLQLNAMRATNATPEVKEARELVKQQKLVLPYQPTDLGEKKLRGDNTVKLTKAVQGGGLQLQEVERRLKAAPRDRKPQHKDRQPYTPLERVEGAVKNAIRWGIGNCGECASVAYLMLLDYQGPPEGDTDGLPPLDSAVFAFMNPNVERVGAIHGDHCFVLINRNTTIDICDTNQWMTNSVVVCDPWWFHTGDAILANGDQDGRLAFIKSWAAVTMCLECHTSKCAKCMIGLGNKPHCYEG